MWKSALCVWFYNAQSWKSCLFGFNCTHEKSKITFSHKKKEAKKRLDSQPSNRRPSFTIYRGGRLQRVGFGIIGLSLNLLPDKLKCGPQQRQTHVLFFRETHPKCYFFFFSVEVHTLAHLRKDTSPDFPDIGYTENQFARWLFSENASMSEWWRRAASGMARIALRWLADDWHSDCKGAWFINLREQDGPYTGR